MIRIKKFKNVFGITKLIGAENFGRINIVYAPNGTAKSSFCDAIKNISMGEDVSDIYGLLPAPEYEIIVDGKTITQESDCHFDVVCFSGLNEFNYDRENVKLMKLAISSETKKKVSDSKKKIDDCIVLIRKEVQSIFGSEFGKKKCNDSLLYMFGSLDENNLYEEISNLIAEGDYDNLDIKFSIQDFYLFATSKVDAAVHKKDVLAKGKEYVEIIDKKLKTDIFDEDFSYFNLKNVFQSAINNNFFDKDGTRLLKINEVEYKKESLETFLNNKASEIFGSKELSSVFEGVKKDITKNKETNSLFEFLKKNPSLFLKLENYHKLVLSVFVSLFSEEQLNAIKICNQKIAKENNNIAGIIDDEVKDTKIHEIWTKFEKNFSTTKFDLKIKNELDSYLGTTVPTFIKCIRGTDEEITDPDELRFSTGEKHVYNFIDFIIDVESKRDGTPLTIILDDAAESFDYKNKFGIIDYISSLADDNNLQLIILTHNFDFYRSVILAIQEKDKKLFFAYRNSKNEISFFDSDNRYYLNVSDFNSWKNNPTIEKYLSLIGFSRQIIQFQTSSKDHDVLKLDNYLHFNEGTTDLEDFNVLQSVLVSNNIKHPASICLTDNYLKTLNNVALDICNKNIIETDLEYKLVLGLALRVFFERLIFLEYHSVNGVSYVVENNFRRSKELLNIAKQLFNDEDYLCLTEINTINPSYVHVNGFMYEPLIDVGVEKLVDLYKWLSSKNRKFPF